MAKITLNNVSSGYNLAEINNNFQEIENALNNLVLYRNPPNGEPNTLEKDLDVNGKGLLNIGDITVDGKSLSSFVTGAEAAATAAAISETNAAISEGNAATSETNAAASASIVADWEWKGAWTSSTAYVINNIVSNSGSTYICTVAHTSSGSFDAGNWELLAQQGLAGTGTGDMVGANNLSELTNTSIARANIGLGNVNNTSDVNKPVSTATQTAIDAAIAAIPPVESVPAGAVQAFAMATPPSGWLKCNGAALSRTTYSTLFAAIGVVFGAGDGSTTFNIPDLRGEFVRGLDDGRGVDIGRTIGSSQADSFKSHTHTADGWSAAQTFSVYDGVIDGSYNAGGSDRNYVQNPVTSATGDTETRPRNIALLYCIKY